MLTIELTESEAEELRSALRNQCDELELAIENATMSVGPDDPDIISYRYQHSVLTDILKLLEIS